MKRGFSVVGLLCLLVLPAGAGPLQTYRIWLQQTSLLYTGVDVRVGIQSPDETPIGDILYLPGFADRLDNHGPLFDAWNRAGFRVISFDYPSHGETSGDSINFYTFKRLASLAVKVEEKTRGNPDRPLIVAGWSTGGLLAVRMVQSPLMPRFGRAPRGLILFAPGVAVRPVVGQPSLFYPLGKVTNETLTHDPNPPHLGAPRPASPGATPLFASYLLYNSIRSRMQPMPTGLPILTFVGGQETDRYVDSDALTAWIEGQQAGGADIQGISVPGARHELDNELDVFGGQEVRILAANFAKGLIGGDSRIVLEPSAICRRILK